MLSFKELLAVDYTRTGDDQLAKNAKKRKRSDDVSEELDLDEDLSDEELDLISVDEAILTPAQRIRRKQVLRKNKAKIAMGKLIASRRMATKQRIEKRAKRRARRLVLKRILKSRDKSDLAYTARAGYEKMLAKRKGGIDRISKRLAVKVRKDDIKKFQSK